MEWNDRNRLKEVIELLYKIKEEQKNNREKDKIQYCIHILNMLYKNAVWTNCDNCKYKTETIKKFKIIAVQDDDPIAKTLEYIAHLEKEVNKMAKHVKNDVAVARLLDALHISWTIEEEEV